MSGRTRDEVGELLVSVGGVAHGLDEVVAEGTALEQHAEIGAVKGHRSALRGGATWPCLFCLLYNL